MDRSAIQRGVPVLQRDWDEVRIHDLLWDVGSSGTFRSTSQKRNRSCTLHSPQEPLSRCSGQVRLALFFPLREWAS